MKPLIGITCNYIPLDNYGFSKGIGTTSQDWQLVAGDYIYAVERAGGLPVIIPFFEDPAQMVEMLNRLDGILVSGGNDLDPQLYGERCKPCTGEISLFRDRQDLFLSKYAIEHTNLPVLGICRGIQVINAAMGGTVHQDLEEEGYLEHSLIAYPRDVHTHTVSVEPDSLLARSCDAETLRVNSFHHQGVNRVAEGFRVTARSQPDGVVEAIELPGKPYVLAVQWHPEMLGTACPNGMKLFEDFVAACAK